MNSNVADFLLKEIKLLNKEQANKQIEWETEQRKGEHPEALPTHHE